ncbi:O-antigen ligase family protein [Oryzicola mucosus]|uniref:O-antigen ligase family protein n=1 Tax=Oryzicola mucosus TaxID=2767425 RepID=A0A8J6Q1M6_9HYPH|nr:O-antigen ligase family protein [Oryzicola mucosus]
MTRLGNALFFVAAFALFWITTTPFLDLRNPDVLLPQEAGNTSNQVAVLLVLFMSCVVLWQNKQAALTALSPAMLCVLAWQLVTVFTSSHIDLSVRRYILHISVVVITLAWLLAPQDTRQFRRLLRWAGMFVLGLAYFGVVFLPEVSIHSASDVLEQVNAGGWRGHFMHKNVAGPAMVVLLLYWLYLAQTAGKTSAKATYWALAALSLLFLYHTNNKTSIGLLLVMFVLAFAIQKARLLSLQLVLGLVPTGLMALLTVGSVIFKPVGDWAEMMLSDPTFTNRTDVWRFALDQLRGHMVAGFGFEAYWATSDLVNSFRETWANTAGHAHNGLINVALSSGLVGAGLTIWWLVLNPLRDFHKSQQSGNDPQLGLLFLRIWLFMMLYANLESPFYVGRGQVWFSLLGAVFGLRLHARLKQVAAPSLQKPVSSPAAGMEPAR